MSRLTSAPSVMPTVLVRGALPTSEESDPGLRQGGACEGPSWPERVPSCNGQEDEDALASRGLGAGVSTAVPWAGRTASA